jgi:multicopper oxidase
MTATIMTALDLLDAFQVNGTGPLKDTVNVLPGQTVTCDFDTGNPGQWMARCHNVYHEQSGMMSVIGYIT